MEHCYLVKDFKGININDQNYLEIEETKLDKLSECEIKMNGSYR